MQDLLETLDRLINYSQRNRTQKLTAIELNINKINQLIEKINNPILTNIVREKLSSLDEENICIREFKENWTEIKPAGDTPKKRECDHIKDLVHFDTPVSAKTIKAVDDSLLDISVGLVNISSASPEIVENLDELEEAVILQVYICYN